MFAAARKALPRSNSLRRGPFSGGAALAEAEAAFGGEGGGFLFLFTEE